MFVFTITYNFDGSYVAKGCNTYKEALKLLKKYLNEEIKTVKRENGYTPSVLRWNEDDITLVYAAGYTKDSVRNEAVTGHTSSYANEDCAYYRIMEVEM